MIEMVQHDTLYCLGGQRDRPRAKQGRYHPQYGSADAAQMEATAAPDTSPLQLRAEKGAVPLLVAQEMLDLWDHVRRAPPGDPSLRTIDGDRSMLTSMIDLERSLSKTTRGTKRLGHCKFVDNRARLSWHG